MITSIDLPIFDKIKLRANSNFNNAESVNSILTHMIHYFNDCARGYQLLNSNNYKYTKIIGQGLIFNFYMIEKLIKMLGASTSERNNLDVKKIRDCIAHFDERIKYYYNPNKTVQPAAFSDPSISTDNQGNVSITGQTIVGSQLTVNSDASCEVTAPLGYINHTFIGLDRDGTTITIKIDTHLLQTYKNQIESIVAKYTLS